MPDWLRFRGVIGRVRFVATLAGLMLAVSAVGVLLNWMVDGRRQAALILPTVALSLFALVLALWTLAAAVTKRSRDAGLPLWLFPALIALGVADSLLARATGWRGLWPELKTTPLMSLANLAFWGLLALRPGRAADGDRPGWAPPGWRGLILAGLGVVAVLAAGALAFDPYQPAACRAKPQPAQADCARFGFAGRVYAAMLLVRANKALDNKRPQDALTLIARAMTIRPHHAMALNSRGLARAALGDQGAAQADYTEALAIAPGYIKAMGNRARSHLALGELSEAKADLDAIRAADPKTPGYADWVRFADNVQANLPKMASCSAAFEPFLAAFGQSVETQRDATAQVVRMTRNVLGEPEPGTEQRPQNVAELRFPVMPLAGAQAAQKLERRLVRNDDGSMTVSLSRPDSDAQTDYRFVKAGCWQLVGIEDRSL